MSAIASPLEANTGTLGGVERPGTSMRCTAECPSASAAEYSGVKALTGVVGVGAVVDEPHLGAHLVAQRLRQLVVQRRTT